MTLSTKVNIDALVEGTIQQIYLNEKLTLPIPDVIDLTRQLKQFELGKTMMISCGLTSSSVDYICHHDTSPTDHNLENWFLSKAPRIKAARERYNITKSILQSLLKSGVTLGVMPCGVISKVAELDYSKLNKVKIVGYDRDVSGLVKAEQQMQPLVDQEKVNLFLLKKNIWLLDDRNQHNVILSNRLSVMEHSSSKVVELLKKFHSALTKNGVLVSSFFTPSPLVDVYASTWKDIYAEDVLKEHCIFEDILDFHPAARTEEEMQQLLHEAGFEVLEIHNDTHCIYPTITARKR